MATLNLVWRRYYFAKCVDLNHTIRCESLNHTYHNWRNSKAFPWAAERKKKVRLSPHFCITILALRGCCKKLVCDAADTLSQHSAHKKFYPNNFPKRTILGRLYPPLNILFRKDIEETLMK